MEVFKNKFLWIAVISGIIELINWFVVGNYYPATKDILTTIITVLYAISNYIAGVKTENQVKLLKAKLLNK